MNNKIIKAGVVFEIGKQTPRRNEYERKQGWRLFVNGIPTSYTFGSVAEGKKWIDKNYYMYL